MILKLLYVTLCSIFLSGCLSTLEHSVVPDSQKEVDQKLKDIKIQERMMVQQKYKKCEEHRKMMKYALSYVVTEFEQGYFEDKNIVGAKAQLFLIQNRSQSLFAKNINDAEHSYTTHFQLAKKEKCELKDVLVSPIKKVTEMIGVFENELSL